MTKKKYRVSKFNILITVINLLLTVSNIVILNNDTPSEVPVVGTTLDTSITCTAFSQNGYMVGPEIIETTPEVAGPIKEEPSYFIDVGQNGMLTEQSIRSISEYVGTKTGVNPILLQAIAWGESRYKIDVISKDGAVGICQIMPTIHSQRLIKLGVTDLKDPYQNMMASADYIKDIEKSKYGNDQNFVIMAYKSGIGGATKKYEQGTLTTYVTYINTKIFELEELYHE